MVRRMSVLALAGLTGLGLTLPAAAVEAAATLTLETAIKSALKHHPDVSRQEQLLRASEAKVEQDFARYRPQAFVGFLGQLGTNGFGFTLKTPDIDGAAPSSMVNGKAVDQPGPFVTGLTLTIGQMLWSPKLLADMNADKLEDRTLAARQQLARALVIFQAKRAYLMALQAQHAEHLANDILKERTLTLQQAQALADAGLVSRLDAAQARMRQQVARTTVLEAANEARTARHDLQVAMGRSPNEAERFDLVEEPAPAAPPADDAVPPASPVLTPLTAEKKQAEARIEVARAATMPQAASYFSGGIMPSLLGDAFNKGIWSLGVQLKAPIWTSGLAEAQVAEAEAKAKAAAEQLRAATEAWQRDTLASKLALGRDLEQLAVLNDQVAVAQQSLDLARNRYQVHLASYLDVVTAETTAAEVRQRHLEARYRLILDRAKLDFLLGQDLARYVPEATAAAPGTRSPG